MDTAHCLYIDWLFLVNYWKGCGIKPRWSLEKFRQVLKMCHVNIRMLSRAKLLAIKPSLMNVYDIITVTETHLHQGIGNDLFHIKSYHKILRKDKDGNRLRHSHVY